MISLDAGLKLGVVAVVLAAGAWGLHSMRSTAYDAGYATCDAAVTKEAFKTTEKVRAKEILLTNKNTKVTNDYKAENERLRADADDTRRLLDNLQAAANSASATDSGTSTGIADPYPRAFVECAIALTEVDKEYQRVRGVAQSLQRYASEVCVNN